jgi:hypothetical protein
VNALTQANLAVEAVSNASSMLDCHHAQDLFADAVIHGLCGDGLEGLYVLTVTLFVFSGCLFASMCVGCVLWQYFGEAQAQAQARARSDAPTWPDEVIDLSPSSPPYPYPSCEEGAEGKGEEPGAPEDGDGDVMQLPLKGCKCPLCAACK